MSVQLFLSEVFVTLALFALGVVGYALSKHGKGWCFRRCFSHVGKTTASEEKVASQEMPPVGETLTKKVTTQAKNAEARRRSKRQQQGRSKGSDELVEKAAAELQQWPHEFDGVSKKDETCEVQSSPYANDECFTEYVIAPTLVTDWPKTQVIDLSNKEEIASGVTHTSMVKEQESFSPMSLASTRCEEEQEREHDGGEGTTTPGTHDEAELSEHLQHDSDDGVNQEVSREEPLCAPMEEKDDPEQDEATMVQSDLEGDNDCLLDFAIPSTPPPEEDMFMPTYTLDGGHASVDTPTNAQSFTDGQQIFEPVPSPDGQQLYTDGQQVFMLACVEVPSTPCAGTQSDTDPFGMASSTYGTDPFGMVASTYGDLPGAHAGVTYGCADNSCDNDAGDLWNVCWEDFIPGAFAPADF
jgi:hypothetical protein